MKKEPEDDLGYLDEFKFVSFSFQSLTILQKYYKKYTQDLTHQWPPSVDHHNLCNKLQSPRYSRSHTIFSYPVADFSLNRYICPNILYTCHTPQQTGVGQNGRELQSLTLAFPSTVLPLPYSQTVPPLHGHSGTSKVMQEHSPFSMSYSFQSHTSQPRR